MTSLTTGAQRRADRVALRDRLVTAAPDGLIWLDSTSLRHPEATRAARLAFPFALGRISGVEGKRTVREAELVLEGLRPDQDDATALESYARFVLATVPTIHARLTGRTLAAWLEQVGA